MFEKEVQMIQLRRPCGVEILLLFKLFAFGDIDGGKRVTCHVKWIMIKINLWNNCHVMTPPLFWQLKMTSYCTKRPLAALSEDRHSHIFLSDALFAWQWCSAAAWCYLRSGLVSVALQWLECIKMFWSAALRSSVQLCNAVPFLQTLKAIDNIVSWFQSLWLYSDNCSILATQVGSAEQKKTPK